MKRATPKRKPSLIAVSLPVYKTGVYVSVGDRAAARRHLTRTHGDCPEIGFDRSEGKTVWDEGKDLWVFVWVLRQKDRAMTLDSLAHEAVHAALRILHTRGVKVDPDNDEALTYLVGHIVRETVRMFRL